MGLEITVIDDSDHVGYAAAMVREGEIYTVNVASMVANVIARLRVYSRVCTPVARYNKISRSTSSTTETRTASRWAPTGSRRQPYLVTTPTSGSCEGASNKVASSICSTAKPVRIAA